MDLVIERARGVLTLQLNRPDKKNAMTAAMYQSMADALAQARDDASVRAILIRGHDGVFCAGNDLEDFMQRPPSGPDAPVLQFLQQISTAAKPIVAAVSGPAVGIGTTLLLHCDLVYAADDARFSLPFTQLGLCPEAASSLLLPRLAGYQRAAQKLLLGEPFDAYEAQAIGIVSRVLPLAQLHEFVLAQATKLVALPASSLRVTKMLLKRDAQAQVAQRIAEEAEQFGRMLRSPEAREAMSAFLQKRKPDFSPFE
ncbi:enoyl-CoA hydratase [Mycetohabitans endofungorum]|uniref:enoyl-CoA hydratase n=1 Tax=Mycetohabitans endofungorum TaxID=417203 RepID=UPI002B0605EC|nr:enoyl-CoA hydratase [Mycetohabitans endofungorum]